MKETSIIDVERVIQEAKKKQVIFQIEEGSHTKYETAIERILEETKEATTMDVAAALYKLAFGDLDTRGYSENDLDDDEMEYSSGGMVRLFMNVGSMDNIQPKNIVQGIASKTSMPGKLVGAIDIHKQFTFIEVPLKYADEVIVAMGDFTHKGRKVSIEKATKRERGGSRGRNLHSGNHSSFARKRIEKKKSKR